MLPDGLPLRIKSYENGSKRPLCPKYACRWNPEWLGGRGRFGQVGPHPNNKKLILLGSIDFPVRGLSWPIRGLDRQFEIPRFLTGAIGLHFSVLVAAKAHHVRAANLYAIDIDGVKIRGPLKAIDRKLAIPEMGLIATFESVTIVVFW